MPMSITCDEGLSEPSPGDFGAAISGGALALPPRVWAAVGRLGVRGAEELVSYARSFPAAIAAQLGWTSQDVSTAAGKLVELLEGHVPGIHLQQPPQTPQRTYGALDPKLLRPEQP